MSESLRVAVIGAGAWGLPAAAELVRRGHRVTVIDSRGPANSLASSSGSTRIWRLAHADRLRVRLALRSVESWQRFEARSGETCRLQCGLLWRIEGHDDVAAALAAEGVSHRVLEAHEVGEVYPGLVPNGSPAVWQDEAGSVLAGVAMTAFQRQFEAHGGELRIAEAKSIDVNGDGVVVELVHGRVHADRAVVAAGPWAGQLLRGLDIDLPLRPVVQQVSYVGGPPGELLPCLVDGEGGEGDGAWLYALPTPSRGLKIGLEIPLRELDLTSSDDDRSPSDELALRVSNRVRAILPNLDSAVTASEVCTWTYSPDSRFVIDTAGDGRVAIAVGDSGEGFKFAPLMGEVLADLVEGLPLSPDVAQLSLARFGGHYPMPPDRMQLDH